MTDWKPHLYRAGPNAEDFDAPPEDTAAVRKHLEPWLSAVFQSEHLSVLIGSGFTIGLATTAGAVATDMSTQPLALELSANVEAWANRTAGASSRGQPNIEDQIRAILVLLQGLELLDDPRRDAWAKQLNSLLVDFLKGILATEKSIADALRDTESEARRYLTAFLMSFASRAGSRERLNLFTTNYDRLIEYGCDLLGLRTIDRFVGALSPVFRSSRQSVDLHYNPPGIRGEPRYLEGVIRLTKLHGSIDWRYDEGTIRRFSIPFGASPDHPDLPATPADSLLIYPNPAKDIETVQFPYAELFRDCSAALCQPNSVLVTYGYGFGDDHISRIIHDMLMIPSTHLVIISYDDASGRIPGFCARVSRDSQISLLIGSHFADLAVLVDNYLPKPAIDTITIRKVALEERRGDRKVETPSPSDPGIEADGKSD